MRAYLCWPVLVVLLAAAPSQAFIAKIYPLADILKESTHVMEGKIEKVDVKARTATAVVARTIKGKRQFRRVLMNIGVGPGHHASYLIDRMKPGAPIIFFYKLQGRSIACCAHVGGTWFQLFATDSPRSRSKVWWRMSHLEIYLGRTFNGSTPALITLTRGVLSGRVKAPRPDPKVPKLDPKRRARRVVRTPTGGKRPFGKRIVIRCRGGGEIRGLSWADVNGDEVTDLYVCRAGGNLLLIGQGDGFQDQTRRWGLSGGSRAAAWADFDGDDHPDLMTSNFEVFAHAGTKLRRASGLLAVPKRRNTEGAGWIDYNGDGLPDLLVTNGEHGICLYRNTGRKTGRFRDVSAAAGLGPKGLGAGNGDFVVFFDYDGDGYTDFLYNLGSGVLAHNEGDGKFALDQTSGLKLAAADYKRGVAVADYDNDGDLDVLVPGPRRVQLFRNNNDGTFTDAAKAAGDLAKVKDASFAAAFGDVDGDGKLDLFVCHTRGRGRLYLGDGKGRFKDISKSAGVTDLSPAYGASFVDVDDDGDVDLVVNQDKAVVVAVNAMGRASGRTPLTVRVAVQKGLVGAVVRVTDDAGRPLGMRRLCLADGPGGQTPPTALFALPRAGGKVTVSLSDGRVATRAVTPKGRHTTLQFVEKQFK